MAILAVDEVMLREPRLLVPGMQPVGRVIVNPSHPLGRNARCCLVLNGVSGPYDAAVHSALSGAGLMASFAGAGTTLTIPNSVAWVDSALPNTICWSEYVAAGQAVLNRGMWRIYNTNATHGSTFHIFGGTDDNYRDFSVRGFNNGAAIKYNTGITSPTQTLRHIAISDLGSGSPVASINGRTVATANSASLSATTNDTTLGRGYDYCTGLMGYFFVFASARTQAELNVMTADPFQAFSPA